MILRSLLVCVLVAVETLVVFNVVEGGVAKTQSANKTVSNANKTDGGRGIGHPAQGGKSVKPKGKSGKPFSKKSAKSLKNQKKVVASEPEEIEVEGGSGRPGQIKNQIDRSKDLPEQKIKMPKNYKEILEKSFKEVLTSNETYEETLQEEVGGRAGLIDERFRWKSYSMKIQLDPKFPPKKAEQIKAGLYTLYEAMDKCFQFIIVPSKNTFKKDEDFVYMKWKPNLASCYANMGRYSGMNVMQITNGCHNLYGTTMHEVMHLLGFHHEHLRPDRDKFITIDWSKLATKAGKKAYEIRKGQKIFVNEYDFHSIMHYPKGIVQPKVRVPYWVKKVGQRNYLSGGDKKRLKAMYPCSKAPSGNTTELKTKKRTIKH